MKFKSKKPHYEYLRKKWISKQKATADKFISNHGDSLRHLTLGGVSGLMLLTTPGSASALPTAQVPISSEGITRAEDKNAVLAEALKPLMPSDVRKLDTEEETNITGLLSGKLQVKTAAELDGIRLNRNYGLIGGEQHLYRYPGDNLYKHFENAADWAMYGPAGIAPGLGAWGYFAPSEGSFDQTAKDEERYYLAIQTFLAPGYAENTAEYRDFFKNRKMLVVNPKTGQSVVVVIGDAGPAEWTGKHLGGSPEVMHYLGLAGGPRKGAVLYFFIDDPNNQVPLGPISMKGG
jgi:hypothetical protein